MLLAILIGGGFVNYRIVRPALLRVAADPAGLTGRPDGAARALLVRLARTIELEVARGVAVRIAGVEQTERPLRVVLSDEGDAELELRARDGRRARRTVHASDDGATLDLPRRPRRGAPETSSLWGSPY